MLFEKRGLFYSSFIDFLFPLPSKHGAADLVADLVLHLLSHGLGRGVDGRLLHRLADPTEGVLHAGDRGVGGLVHPPAASGFKVGIGEEEQGEGFKIKKRERERFFFRRRGVVVRVGREERRRRLTISDVCGD